MGVVIDDGKHMHSVPESKYMENALLWPAEGRVPWSNLMKAEWSREDDQGYLEPQNKWSGNDVIINMTANGRVVAQIRMRKTTWFGFMEPDVGLKVMITNVSQAQYNGRMGTITEVLRNNRVGVCIPSISASGKPVTKSFATKNCMVFF